jgi:hypothetical protein
MFTVEVLISLLLLFLTITLSATSSKFFNRIITQQERYQDIYIAVFNIKDKIFDEICTSSNKIEDMLSGVEYHATCTKLNESRNFVKEYDFEENTMLKSYTGPYLVTLYQVHLELINYNYSVEYTIFKYKKSTS